MSGKRPKSVYSKTAKIRIHFKPEEFQTKEQMNHSSAARAVFKLTNAEKPLPK